MKVITRGAKTCWQVKIELTLTDPEGVDAWRKTDSFEIAARVGRQLAELAPVRTIDSMAYRDMWGMWSLFVVDLGR